MTFQSQESSGERTTVRSHQQAAAELRLIASFLEQADPADGSIAASDKEPSPVRSLAPVRSVEVDYLLRVRTILGARRERDRLFGSSYFADPAWDILLDLFEARLTGSSRSIKSSCHAARVPLSTALRHIDRLIDSGLVERANDPGDGRRTLLSLTPTSQKLMMRLLEKMG